MFHILFPSALWLWVHNKGSWMSDSTVLKLWKNNPDLKLCFSFQPIQNTLSSIHHGSDRSLTWVFTVSRCHFVKNFFAVPEQTCPQTASIFLRGGKKPVVFLTHPPVCVYMLSVPPVPAGKCVCFYHVCECVFKRAVPCPAGLRCLHGARLKGPKFLVFQGMRNTWGARFMRQSYAKAAGVSTVWRRNNFSQ